MGAAAEPAGRAVAAADPTADAAAPALAGIAMGFVGTAAARGAPLADAGCDGVGFGVAAEADENDCVFSAVAAGCADVEGCAAAPAAVDSGCAVGADLRGGVVMLAVGAKEADEEAAAAVAAVADDEGAAGAGASPDAKSDGSIIGAAHVPE